MSAMNVLLEGRPLWAVLVSLLAAVAIYAADRRPNLREGATMLAAFLKFAIIVSMLPEVLSGRVVEIAPFYLAPGIPLHLKADHLGTLFAIIASGLWILTSIYSIGYMRSLGYAHQTGYFASFAVCLSSTIGIAFAANLLTFFVFYEVLTIATYPLVVHSRTEEAVSAGRKYLLYTLVAGQFLLAAVVWVQMIAPGVGFTPGGFLQGRASAFALWAIFVLFVAGCGVKAAIMPLHGWLPTAMVAPTPVSALLHAVAVVKAGVFGMLRVSGYVFGPELLRELGAGTALAWLAAITIVAASLIALTQDNLKRRLAFSTVSQLSYVILGAALATPAAIAGAAFHMAAHAFMKIALFFCAGAIYVTTHKENVSEMAGLGRKMPVTMGAFTLAALGLAGIPLIAGFVSKWNLALGALEAGSGVFVGVLVISALLNIGYFFPIIYSAYFGNRSTRFTFGEAAPALLVPVVLTAAAALVFGIFPNAGLELWRLAASAANSVVSAGQMIAGGGT